MADEQNKLYYDAHARNVIVDCKDGKDLETLIKNGEIGGSGIPDMSDAVQILYMSTMPNLDTIADPAYNYTYIGDIDLVIDETIIAFYAYIRYAAVNDNIPVGTVIISESDDIAVINKLGGGWKMLGKMVFSINKIPTEFYAYEKISVQSSEEE